MSNERRPHEQNKRESLQVQRVRQRLATTKARTPAKVRKVQKPVLERKAYGIADPFRSDLDEYRSQLVTEAKRLMWRARERGEIVPRPCEDCGAEKAQGHHDDYAKPLTIRWLCSKHHAAYHRAHGPGLPISPRWWHRVMTGQTHWTAQGNTER